MANTEFSVILNMLNEINHKFDSLEKKFDTKIDAFEKKVDSKINSLEEKFDGKFNSLEEKFDALENKVDNNSTNIITILNTISKVQKDIIYLRDDIETVYSLEKDSRQQLKRLL